MKKTLITCLLLVVGSVAGHAQQVDTVQMRHDKEALARVEIQENNFVRKTLLQMGVNEAVITRFKQIAKDHNDKLKGFAKEKGTTKDKKYERFIQSTKTKIDREIEILGREKYEEYIRLLAMNRHIEQMED